MNAKTIKQRVEALRKHRKEAGLTRLELYVHLDDREPIKLYAATLQADRDAQRLLGAHRKEQK